MKNYFFVLFLLTCISLQAHPHIQKGYVYLTHDELEDGIRLDGDWRFYWQTTFRDYNDSSSRVAQYVQVPGNWGMLSYPRKGYGLYTLHLVSPNIKGKELAIDIGPITTAYRVYIDGELKDTVGIFSVNESESRPDYFPKMIRFIAQSDTVEFAVEVSNYFYREGGINYHVSLGYAADTEFVFHRNLIFEAFMMGTLLLMFLYFSAFYAIRTSDRTVIYFALLCLVSAVRIVSTGQILLRQTGICIPWELLIKIEFASIIMIPMFGILYLHTLLEEKVFNKWVIGMTSISVILVLLSVGLNSYHASFIVPPFRLYALIELFFLMVIIVRAFFFSKHPLARLAVLGYVFVFVFGLNDILYSSGFLNTQYLLPVGIIVYVLIQAVVLTRKFSSSFDEVQQLSDKLQSINRSQEHIIDQRTAELQNYNTIKSKIFAIISHDLRAPIATLSSVLTLIEEADDETITELKTYFKGIKRSVDNLNLTIENLLLWSQSQINGITLNQTAVNLNKEVENVFALYSLVALQKEISLMPKLNEQYDVFADKAHLNMILRNLISNSLKFTNVGGTIFVTCSEVEDGFAKMCISDDGIGIREEKLKQMFDPTVHYTSYGTLNEKGTGLGLMLCKEYIERNGGRITIESSFGFGTKVCLWIPMNIKGR
jgi:signal transduction histidine kinase